MMYSNKFMLLFLIFPFMVSSCGTGEDRKNLEKTRQELLEKEQRLTTYEQQLDVREKDILRREQLLDSLKRQADTVGTYNPAITGTWTVTMECTETTCEGYAVGDTKTEQWKIAYQGNKVVVKATANKKLVRSYTGLFNENILKLTAQPPPDAETHMDVILSPRQASANLMEGSRVINRGGNCKVVFTLKAEKQ